MTTAANIVLDSWPVIAYLQGEDAADRVVEIIAGTHNRKSSLAMSAVNAGEVWYVIARRLGPDKADAAIDVIRSIGITIADVDWATSKIAADYKAGGGISYADCFAAALAKQTGATLVTGDPEFRRLEKEIVIEWL
jgi:predicted nucleic acid-binding protein